MPAPIRQGLPPVVADGRQSCCTSRYRRHPDIRRIFVDGLTALELLERHVRADLPTARLRSSSGALAMSFVDKPTCGHAVL